MDKKQNNQENLERFSENIGCLGWLRREEEVMGGV